jgi:heterodisulfide reductase subunit A
LSINPKIPEFGEPESLPEESYDVIIIGGGIAGMQAALDLGDMGKRVIIVDKEPSIGGNMFKLSKTFPTMDCASCIATPKMTDVAHHPNIKILTYSEVKTIDKEEDETFRANVFEKPRYVDASACTACRQCEDACPVIVPSEYDLGLIGRKAVFVPFETGVPKVALIDMENCVYCGACERVCPADSINFLQTPKWHTLRAKSVVVATGFQLFDAKLKAEYHFSQYPNVVTSMQMERLLAPTRPTHAIVRPSDAKEPQNIAYVLCVGSRDTSLGNPYCSQVCCMYSIKQAQLLMGALPVADITIYYIDIRAYGKGFEEFYVQARAMGVKFVKAKIAKIEQLENGNLVLYYEDVENGGRLTNTEHDLAVLSVGLLPNSGMAKLFNGQHLAVDSVGWIRSPDENGAPLRTSIDGVFVAGTATGPKDIPDSVIEGSAACMNTIAYINTSKRKIAIEVAKSERR